MTSEICLMNRLAVVLAADSATTVTQWVNGQQERRYFKGANKIFQLSDAHPIGVMIYDSADLLRVPWETTVKEFRRELADKNFNDVQGYANEFFQFLSDNKRFFPDDVREAEFRRACINLGLTATFDAKRAASIALEQPIGQAELDAHIDTIEKELNPDGLRGCFNVGDVTGAVSRFADQVAAGLGVYKDGPLGLPDNLDALATYAIKRVFEVPEKYFATTGLVFAGFGDHDVFPTMLSYKSCGIVIDKHVADLEKTEQINQEIAASINPFAQTSMSDTFISGLSFDVYESLMEGTSEVLEECSNSLSAEGHLVDGAHPAVQALLTDARRKIGETVLGRARRDHGLPLRRVLAVLPVDELAELAETLIRLEALKEKVTRPSASVGGPIDVAVITRSEGLVWIRRKHFFEQPLNPRYFQRQLSGQ